MALDLAALTLPPVKTVAALMNFADHLGAYSRSTPPRRMAFRGQPREYQTLAPSFMRHIPAESYGAAELVEQELIRDFRTHYAKLPDRSSDMPPPESIAVGRDLRCLSVMQHYEVPTRLLDWTSNFWIAVYFACAGDVDSNAELWLYDRAIFEPQLKKQPKLETLLQREPSLVEEPPLLTWRGTSLIVELDPNLTPRMREQAAHHTVSAHVFTDHAPMLKELAEEAALLKADEFYFRRIVIDRSCKINVLRFLANYRNITASTIFPDVVGLGRFLRWQLDSLRTMLM